MSTIDINNIDPQLLNEDDRITAYLKGRMTEEEELVFLKDLQDNPTLKERAIAMARFVKGLKDVGNAHDVEVINAFLLSSKQQVKGAVKGAIGRRKDRLSMQNAAIAEDSTVLSEEETETIRNQEVKDKKHVSIRSITAWISIAASLVLIIWVGIGYNDNRRMNLLAEEYESAFESSLISRGATTSEAESRLITLFCNISTKTDLENTLHELSLLWELSTMETYNDYTEYASEIGWNLAIGYLKDNDKKHATKILKALVELTSENTAIGVKAKQLLESLS